jgi:hypothetical protein
MTTQTRTLLILSLIGFALAPTGVAWGLGLPLGFIFFGLFMVSRIMQQEVARFDVEQQSRNAPMKREDDSAKKDSADDEHHHDSSFRRATSH